MPRYRLLAVLLLVTLLVPVWLYTPSTTATGFKIWYYAKELVYPNPGIPEPALIGGELELRFSYGKDAKIEVVEAKVFNEIYSCKLKFEKSTWSDLWKGVVVYLSIPKECKEGFYSLELKLRINGKDKTILQPNSVWLLKEWPKKIKLLYVADTKTPTGEPYWKRMALLTNVLNPTLMIFGGDEVDKPTYRSAWIKFLKWWLQLRIPSYAGIGNHEYEAPGRAMVWQRFFGYRNYSVTIGKFLLVLLDSGMDGWIPSDQLDWLEKVLKENPDKVKIVYMHHPIFSLKWKEERRWYFKIPEGKTLDEIFDYLVKRGYIYGSMAAHREETKRLFKLLLEHGVRLVLSGHIHQDLNVVVEYRGTKYYFITVAGVPFDVPPYVPRGFRLIEIFDNGTIVEETLTCCGKGFADYPTDIPIDVGDKVLPYELGVFEFYYTPANDGSRKAVSFRFLNPVNQWFRDIYIAFRVSKEVPFEKYKIVPKADYEVYELDKYYLVVLKGIDVPPNATIKYTIYAVEDKEKPKIVEVKLGVEPPFVESWKGYIVGYVKAYDDGWGIDEISIEYLAGGKWKKLLLMDLDEDATEDGYVAYYFWLPAKDKVEKLKVVVKDFAGNTVEKVYSAKEVVATKPTPPTASPIATPTPKPTPKTTPIVKPMYAITKTITVEQTLVKTKTVEKTLTKTMAITKEFSAVFTVPRYKTITVVSEKMRHDIAVIGIGLAGAIAALSVAFSLRRRS